MKGSRNIKMSIVFIIGNRHSISVQSLATNTHLQNNGPTYVDKWNVGNHPEFYFLLSHDALKDFLLS
jgi:hypothetical protein